jgi:hypothetical protein
MNDQLWEFVLKGIEMLCHLYELGQTHIMDSLLIISAFFGVLSSVNTFYQWMKRDNEQIKKKVCDISQ